MDVINFPYLAHGHSFVNNGLDNTEQASFISMA